MLEKTLSGGSIKNACDWVAKSVCKIYFLGLNPCYVFDQAKISRLPVF